MKTLALFIALFPLTVNATTSQKFSEIYKSGKLSISVSSSGGHLFKCAYIRLINKTEKPIEIEMEPGAWLDSDENAYQDLITTKKEIYTLLPGKPVTRLVDAYCMQAHHSSPKPNAKYTYKGNADSSLIKLVNFLGNNRIEGELAQQAIWIITDKNDLESINSGTDDLKQKVIDYLVKDRGIKKRGNYEIIYRQLADKAFSGQALKVNGIINYKIPEGAYNSLLIQDEKGKTYAIIYYREFEKAGAYAKAYNFQTKNLPKGIYYARLYSNQQIIAEEKIDLL
ncbi:MAG: hypothetical protein IT239_06620 [Bacteroidia bacterium]|nr:hypothetical protein [Bacteroidia bacterium]